MHRRRHCTRALPPILSVLLLLIACKGGGADSTNIDSGVGNGNPTQQEPSAPDASVVIDGASPTEPGFGNPPPGCTDGAPYTRFFLLDATRIRITSLVGSPATMCTGTGGTKSDCAFDYYDAILTVPSTSVAGSWTLPSSEVSLQVVREFPINRADTGCTCKLEIATPRAITSGKVSLETVDAGAQFANIAITLEAVSFDSKVTGVGTRSSLIEPCN